MDFSKGVMFDPGYSKYTVSFVTNIDAAYNVIFSMKAMHQRKFKFQLVYPQIIKLLEQTISFYLGCLLWATYIHQAFESSPKEVLDNDYLGKDINEEDFLYEVNYIISYLDKLKKDCKYYLKKECNIPTAWYEIMHLYKAFLTQNDYLVNCKTTSDIVLPDSIKNLSLEDLNSILDVIKNVVETGSLKNLFEMQHFILPNNN